MAARGQHGKSTDSVPIQPPKNCQFLHADLEIRLYIVAMVVGVGIDGSQIRSQDLDAIKVEEDAYPLG